MDEGSENQSETVMVLIKDTIGLLHGRSYFDQSIHVQKKKCKKTNKIKDRSGEYLICCDKDICIFAEWYIGWDSLYLTVYIYFPLGNHLPQEKLIYIKYKKEYIFI